MDLVVCANLCRFVAVVAMRVVGVRTRRARLEAKMSRNRRKRVLPGIQSHFKDWVTRVIDVMLNNGLPSAGRTEKRVYDFFYIRAFVNQFALHLYWA